MAVFLSDSDKLTVPVGSGSITIIRNLIPDSARATKDVASYVKKGDKVKPCAKLGRYGRPLGITVHNTAMINAAQGTDPAEQYARATYPNLNMGGAAVHFYVWHDKIRQLLREDEQGWHATDGASRRASHRVGEKIGGNLDTIAIEAIGDDAETEENAAKLCAYLCEKYGLDPQLDIYPHNFFYQKKYCPQYILPHWQEFLNKVEMIMNKCDYTQHWAKEYIERAMSLGIMNGYPDGSFKPDGNITRAEVCTVAMRLFDALRSAPAEMRSDA